VPPLHSQAVAEPLPVAPSEPSRKGGFRAAVWAYTKAWLLTLPVVAAVVYLAKDWLWYTAEQAGDLAEVASAALTAVTALSFRRTRGFVMYLAFTVLLVGVRYATMFPKRQEQLRVANRVAFINGCTTTRPADVEADFWSQFCLCYADSVLAEFAVADLKPLAAGMKAGTPDPRLEALATRCADRLSGSP
jgi:hypothetical protein